MSRNNIEEIQAKRGRTTKSNTGVKLIWILVGTILTLSVFSIAGSLFATTLWKKVNYGKIITIAMPIGKGNNTCIEIKGFHDTIVTHMCYYSTLYNPINRICWDDDTPMQIGFRYAIGKLPKELEAKGLFFSFKPNYIGQEKEDWAFAFLTNDGIVYITIKKLYADSSLHHVASGDPIVRLENELWIQAKQNGFIRATTPTERKLLEGFKCAPFSEIVSAVKSEATKREASNK